MGVVAVAREVVVGPHGDACCEGYGAGGDEGVDRGDGRVAAECMTGCDECRGEREVEGLWEAEPRAALGVDHDEGCGDGERAHGPEERGEGRRQEHVVAGDGAARGGLEAPERERGVAFEQREGAGGGEGDGDGLSRWPREVLGGAQVGG